METPAKTLDALRLRNVRIQDGGSCIGISFDGNVILLNKPQISMIEVIKGDTVRIEMGGTTSNVFLKYSDVSAPVVVSAEELRDAIWSMLEKTNAGNGNGDGDCACAPLIQQTNEGINNVVSVISEGNNKIEASNQVLSGMYANSGVLNQTVADANAANIQKLNQVLSETVKVSTNTAASNDRLENIMQSAAGTTANILATNQLLVDNHMATMQTLVSLRAEMVNVGANVSAGNDQLLNVNQSSSGIYNNSAGSNQYLASLDNKFGNNGFLGNMSRKLKTITVQPAISTVAYAAGQVIGGVMTLTGALRAAVMSGTWMGVQVVEKSTQKAPMDIVLFTSNPTAANFADKIAPNWNNDYDKIIGITNIVAANYSTLSTSSGVCLGNLAKRVTSSTGNLYAVAVCNGTPTYASVSHLYFTFYFEQD
jgi:hypothetical protein